MFIKKATLKNGIEQCAFAFWNGYNGVILSISTTCNSFEWDFVLQDPGMYGWHKKCQQRQISTDDVLCLCF
jgi:hypothetical protein